MIARCWLVTALIRSISRTKARRAVITERCSSLKRDAETASRCAIIGRVSAAGSGCAAVTEAAISAAWVSGGSTAKAYSIALLPRRFWPSQPSRCARICTARSVPGNPGRPANSRDEYQLRMVISQQTLQLTGLARGVGGYPLQPTQLGIQRFAAISHPATAQAHQPVGQHMAGADFFQQRGSI